MTGRDLIIYILSNGLEDEPVCKNGKIVGYISVAEAAEKMDVGLETINLWMSQGRLPYDIVYGERLIPANFELASIN